VKGAERVTGNTRGVLYLVISGAPAPEGLPSLVALLQQGRWRVVVFSTPTGTRFADLDELGRLTGEPVRWEYRMPGTGTPTPPADVVVVVPHCKPQLASHPAFGASLGTLRGMGVRVLFDPAAPYESRLPSWAEVTAALPAAAEQGVTR
jgi:hypothetical protein